MKTHQIMTPMVSSSPNVRVKLEHLNPASSHKSRSARHIIQKAINDGELRSGGRRRILEKSGGNFGVGLAYEAAKHNIGVDLVIGLSFSPLKRRLCEEFGARLIGLELLHQGLQPKAVIAQLLEKNGSDYFFTDQFANPANVDAHMLETGPEIVAQIHHEMMHYSGLTLVISAGTGAHACALHTVLSREFHNFEMVLAEPENCCFKTGKFGTHSQQGAAVGISPPFLDLSTVHNIISIPDKCAFEGQRLLAKDIGIYPGPTGGANYFLASKIAREQPDRLIVTMTYDAGEGYLGQQLSA